MLKKAILFFSILLSSGLLSAAEPKANKIRIDDSGAYYNGTTVEAALSELGSVGFFSNQTANTIFSGPGSGAATDPTFRALVDNDVPDTITLTNLTQVTTKSHTVLSDIGTNAHPAIDTFIASKAAASGLASLDTSSLVVQNPATATATPTASKIPIADGSAKLDGWITLGASVDISTETNLSGDTEIVLTGDALSIASTITRDTEHDTWAEQPALTAANIILGNATNVSTITTISGDINITAAGVTSIQANAVALTDDTTGNYVSSLATTAPLTGGAVGSEGAALTVVIPRGNSTVDGYINATDWTAFNNKLDTTLTSAYIYVGNATNITTAVAVSGDGSMSNAGALTITDDSHAHGTTTLSGIDISADTNLAVTAPVVLTDDTLSLTVAKDLVTTSPLTGGTDDILPGADADITLAITVAKDIVAGVGLSGGEDNVLPGADADTTLTLDLTEINSLTWGSGTFTTMTFDAGASDPVITASSGDLAVSTGTFTLLNTGLHLLDTNATHDLIIKPGSDLTADKTLTFTTGDADRTVTINADSTISGTNTGDNTVATTGDSATSFFSSGTLEFAIGGTGLASWTQYLIPYAATTTSIGQIAIGTSGQVLTSNGAGAAPTFQTSDGMQYTDTRYKVVAATRDLTAATGTQAITGAGFAPKKVTIVGSSGITDFSVGFAASPSGEGGVSQIYDGTAVRDSKVISVYTGAGASQLVTISSWDSDGATLSWVKSGSPSGTFNFWLCFER